MIKDYKFARILEICLKRVLDDGEPRDDVLAAFPEYKKRLQAEVRSAMWLRARGAEAEPRQDFIHSSKKRLVSQLKTNQGQQTTREKYKQTSTQTTRLVLATLIVAAVFVGSLAVAADGSLPGDRLYSVRTTAENLNLALTFNAEDEAWLHRMYAQNHLIDCAEATSQGRISNAETALRNYERHMVGMSRALQAISTQNVEDGMLNSLDVSRIYMEDLEVFRVLLPGSF